ncbi:MAG: TIGR01777 family oxidoreductase [Balneolaceae bacterium]|nr:TIGR01777 family oxidoreductase [Balneolaceae bacterium]
MDTKQILITGGTGFIGNYLSSELLKQGHFLTLVTRSPEKYADQQAENRTYIGWGDDLDEAIPQSDVIINLVGENLFGQRWSESVKKRIYDSRIESTRKLAEGIQKAKKRPELFISASAVGIYGDSGDKELDEASPAGDDFLANVCSDWESEALKAQDYGVRVAIPRIGIVLEEDGGVVEKMLLPFKMFVGGPIGTGNQYVPWIHMKDLCDAILYPIENSEMSGPFNACGPNAATMNELAKKMGSVMGRPSIFRVPEFALNIALGEAAQPVLSSLNVKPKVLEVSGFEFIYSDLEEALADIL